MAKDALKVTYHKLHHCLDAVPSSGIISLMGETPKTPKGLASRRALHRFLTEATWSVEKMNERRLEVINTPQWVVDTYSQRNWVEVFDREAKRWLGLKEDQIRGIKGLKRHFILVFCAYTFMRTRMARLPRHRELSVLWHQLTGGLRRRWANKPINTFQSRIVSISYSCILPFYIMAQSQYRRFYCL